MSTSTLEHRAPHDACKAAVHCITLALLAPSLTAASSFVAFESGPVRPLAMAADGLHLYAVNIPDNRLEIFEISDGGLTHVASVPVGMEPVAVVARGNNEAWVVNHLSDSVSVVRLAPAGTARVMRTLFVGDEPRDIQFAGPGGKRAFITAANRNLPREPGNPERNADIWVFDTDNLGDDQPGGTPLAVVNLPGDVPRALAVGPDGTTVYVAVFNSGNQTTLIPHHIVDGDLPPPLTNFEGVPAPATSLIVRFNGTDWLDAAGRPWTAFQTFSMPDWDVFALDAMTSPPRRTAVYSGVGTVNFNMVTNPTSGNLYVSNLDARNDVRFEGLGQFGGSTVRAHFAENRITVIDGQGVHPRHLNKHINYDVLPGTPDENAKSLALPLQMVVSGDGRKLYAAAFGSSKVGIYNVRALERDTFVPNEADQIEVSGGGPCGLVLDESRDRLYVLTRFDDSIVTVDLATRTEQTRIPLFSPEPASVVSGRRFLYDARFTSSHGDSACGSCHIFGDNDGIAWDLGDPDGVVVDNPNPFVDTGGGVDLTFHPMKGPMVTQSLRGLANHGPMHWRGDRTGGLTGGDPLDEEAAFEAFNGAFVSLMGRETQLSDDEMRAFKDFALQLTYPPNPVRALDNSRTPEQERGHLFFVNFPTLPASNMTCENCHTLDPVQAFFGTAGLSAQPPGSPFATKIPHLRNLYTKEGITSQRPPATGPQIRGFGFLHDGAGQSVFGLLANSPFSFPGGDDQRRDVAAFLLAFDSSLAPIAGRQVTVTRSNGVAARPSLDLLVSRARVTTPLPECDLIVKGNWQGEERGWLREADDYFHSDRISEPAIRLRALLRIAATQGQELTFTCVPPGSGVRMGLDRDEDGYYDRDELDSGTDPADPGSTPNSRDVPPRAE